MSGPKEKQSLKTVIIGGGPAGLTAAYQLNKLGMRSIVLEKDHVVGGLSRTAHYKNYHFDIGGHRFFTKIKAVDEMWREVLGDDLLYRKRISRIYYNKKFFHYPLRPFNTLAGLGVWNSFSIILSYLYAHMFGAKYNETFEQWVTNRFGKRLYHIFFKTYTEKVWGVLCSEIRAEWAAQRIGGLTLVSAIKNALVNSRNKNGKVIKTLIEGFNYPKLGPGMMWRAVADNLQKCGSLVCLGSHVKKILWEKNKITALEIKQAGQIKLIYGTHFLSSMPVIDLIQSFRPAVPKEVLDKANRLRYRDFITVALIVNRRDLFPDNWIYIHDPGVKLGRIQNFKNWSPYMVPDSDKSCLGLEYFCFEGDELWNMTDRELIELGKEELAALGLVSTEDIEDGTVIRMPKAYPIYDSEYKDHISSIRQFLSGIKNLQLVGRNGMHRYNNQDHSMLTAMQAVENICGAKHNLWEINEEQEYHEEDKGSISNKTIMRSFARLDKFSFAVAIGNAAGLFILTASIFLLIKGGQPIGPHLKLLGQFFIGYKLTPKGILIGTTYAFGWGFLLGWLFAYLRNFFLAYFIYRLKKKVELLSFKDFLDHF
jgi:protoporphyrinogen oxidase